MLTAVRNPLPLPNSVAQRRSVMQRASISVERMLPEASPTVPKLWPRTAILAWTICAICWALALGTLLLIGAAVQARAHGGALLPAYVAVVAGPTRHCSICSS